MHRRRRNSPAGSSRAASPAAMLEVLESRILLTGLTIITHGAEFVSTDRPGWLDAMAAAIRARTGGAAGGTAIYQIRVEPDGTGGVGVTSFTRLSGPAESASSNGENVLLLDWAAASNVSLSGGSDFSTSLIASTVMPWLLAPRPAIGLTAPLVEGPIQIIGHSRGASLASVLATDLGQDGIWVDQLTTLDPVPVFPDPAVSIKSNVIFADNYYQTSGDGIFTPNGTRIAGAYNVGPLTLGGGDDFIDGGTHGDVHVFYYGTINTANGANDSTATVQPTWYTGNHLNRDATGYYYSRLGGGTRPLAGIGTNFGGTGARGALGHAGPQWGNLAMVSLPGDIIADGDPFNINYDYDTIGANAQIQWFLDPDTNPYNNNSIPIGSAYSVNATADTVIKAAKSLIANAPFGTYYLEGRIVNAAGTRYAYSSAFSLATAPPAGTVDDAGPAVVDGWVADPDDPTTPLTVTLNVDGTTFATMTANLDHANLPAADGPAHGYSFDLTSLPPGIHTIALYANDTTSGDPVLQLSKTITTNRLPTGVFDDFDGSTISGWAMDPDTTAPIQILYQLDDNSPVLATANGARGDAFNGHGFSITLPQLTAGTHNVTVWAIDANTGERVSLGTLPGSVINPVDNPLPTGHLDSASNTRVTGWAADASVPSTAITVRVDVDGVPGTPMVAKINKPGLKKTIGTINHGFSIPLKLAAGEHRIDVYAIDDQGTPVLLGSRIVKVSKPVGQLSQFTQTQLVGWAYSPSEPNTPPLIRLDIDGIAGAAFTTNVLRRDVNAARHITGTYGFSITTPILTAGTHTVTLELLDPLTMAVTGIVTKSFVTL